MYFVGLYHYLTLFKFSLVHFTCKKIFRQVDFYKLCVHYNIGDYIVLQLAYVVSILNYHKP